jgi:hypothetical protein
VSRFAVSRFARIFFCTHWRTTLGRLAGKLRN